MRREEREERKEKREERREKKEERREKREERREMREFVFCHFNPCQSIEFSGISKSSPQSISPCSATKLPCSAKVFPIL